MLGHSVIEVEFPQYVSGQDRTCRGTPVECRPESGTTSLFTFNEVAWDVNRDGDSHTSVLQRNGPSLLLRKHECDAAEEVDGEEPGHRVQDRNVCVGITTHHHEGSSVAKDVGLVSKATQEELQCRQDEDTTFHLLRTNHLWSYGVMVQLRLLGIIYGPKHQPVPLHTDKDSRMHHWHLPQQY